MARDYSDGSFNTRFHLMVMGKRGHRRGSSRGGVVASARDLGLPACPTLSQEKQCGQVKRKCWSKW